MGSETPLLLQLPVIDFSNLNLKQGTIEWDSARSDVRKALEEFGCFEASFDEIPIELRKAFFGCLQELFGLPLQTKLRTVSEKPFRGYVGQYPQMPLFESMGIDDADVADSVDAITHKLWPRGNQLFSKTIQSFSKQLSELDITIRRMIMESFGLERYIDEHIESTNYLMRAMKYTGPDTEERKIGLSAHKDKSMVSILYQNHVEGLEIQTKDEKWVKVKPSKDSFIAMIGESLHALTNGRLRSPYHRVVMTGSETRFSVALFSIPREGQIIYAAEEIVDEEHPRLFKPLDFQGYLNFSYSEAGRRAKSPLMSFCGL